MHSATMSTLPPPSSILPSSSSPPYTPVRSRYPAHLGSRQQRPQQMRQGAPTNHIYETLEDLLKEAGYKETRVFTPESERVAKPAKKGTMATLISTWQTLRHSASTPHFVIARRSKSMAKTPSPLTAPSSPQQRQQQQQQPRLLSQTRTAHVEVTKTSVVCRPMATRGFSSSTSLASSQSGSRHRSPSTSASRTHLPSLVCECHDSGDDDDEDDDDDGELDLARILIPAKRQHSIRSLRSVLNTSHHHLPYPSPPLPPLPRPSSPLARSSHNNPVDGHWDSGEFLLNARLIKKRRSGLPDWANNDGS